MPEPRLFPSAPRMELSGAGSERGRLHGTGEEGANKPSARVSGGSVERQAKGLEPAPVCQAVARPARTACLSAGPGRGRQQSLDRLGTNGTSSPATPQTTASSEQEHGEAPGRRIRARGVGGPAEALHTPRDPAAVARQAPQQARHWPRGQQACGAGCSRRLLPTPTAPAHTHRHPQLGSAGGSPPPPILLWLQRD